MQEIYFDTVTFKWSINMFDKIDSAENIYEVVIEPPDKKSNRLESTCVGQIKNIKVRAYP